MAKTITNKARSSLVTAPSPTTLHKVALLVIEEILKEAVICCIHLILHVRNPCIITYNYYGTYVGVTGAFHISKT